MLSKMAREKSLNKLTTHEQLMSELKAIAPDHKNKKFYRLMELVKKKNYHGALILACDYCKPGNVLFFNFIKTLLQHKDGLALDLNALDRKGNWAIYHAAINKNDDLYFMLEKAGANSRLANSGQRSAWEIALINGHKDGTFLRAHLTKEFQAEKQQLEQFYNDTTRLPDRNALSSDVENAHFDKNRIEYIIANLTHLIKYYSNLDKGGQLPVTIKLGTVLKRGLYNLGIQFSRKLLAEMCMTIRNLSGETRGQYNKLFELSPFTWITMEQLGGMIGVKPLGRGFSIPVRDIPSRDDDEERILSYQDFSERFFLEYSELEEIIEDAVPDIINIDLPHLKRFFEQIYQQMLDSNNPPVTPVCLVATKALTARIVDNHTLINLLNLLNYSDKEPNPLELGGSRDRAVVVRDNSIPHGKEYTQRFDLSRKSGLHAALRRLQLIGELITGKNFSSELLALDDSIDWRAIITVRDGLVHGDERNNKYIVDRLLADPMRLEQMVGIELSDLWIKLHHLLALREKTTGCYDQDSKAHWQRILKAQQSSLIKINVDSLPIVERRASVENEMVLIAALESTNTPLEVLNQFRGILDGTGPIPDKKTLGQLQGAHFPSRKANPKVYKELAKILTNAISPRTSEKERAEKRLQLEEAARQREIARESKFQGLECLRALAKEFTDAPVREHLLSPLKRIEAAIEALVNMEEFLIADGYFVEGLTFNTMEDWDIFHQKMRRAPLIARLSSNHELNDALEYNAGQLLQHLDTIHQYPEADCSVFLKAKYEYLRSVRNYIEHGDPVLDNPSDNGIADVAALRVLRQKRIAPAVVMLVCQLKQDLEQIRHNILAKVKLDISSSSLNASENEKEEGISNIEPVTVSEPVTVTAASSLIVHGGFFGENKKSLPETPVTTTVTATTTMTTTLNQDSTHVVETLPYFG